MPRSEHDRLFGNATGHNARHQGRKPDAPRRRAAGVSALLAPLPDGVQFVSRPSASTDIVHIFSARRVELERALGSFRTKLKPTAVVWVSRPKKSAKAPTDLTEDVVRALALPVGFVDIKVCAVDDVWSGLKLMVRKGLR